MSSHRRASATSRAKGSRSSSTCQRKSDKNLLREGEKISKNEDDMASDSSLGAKLSRKTRSLSVLNNSMTNNFSGDSISGTQSSYFSDCKSTNKRQKLSLKSRVSENSSSLDIEFDDGKQTSRVPAKVASAKKVKKVSDDESNIKVGKSKLRDKQNAATRIRQRNSGVSNVSLKPTSDVSVEHTYKYPNKNVEERSKEGVLSPSKRKHQDETCSEDIDNVDSFDASTSSDSEWEDVEDLPVQEDLPLSTDITEHHVQEKTVSISLPGPVLIKKKKKSGHSEAFEAFRQILNRYRKRSQENLHKTHLLFLFSLGHWRNRLCSNELLQSLVLSTIPVKFCGKQLGSWSLNCLIDFSKWFQQTFVIENREELHPDLSLALQQHVLDRKVENEHEHTLLFVIACRAMGLETRIIFSLQPISSKPIDLIPKNAKLTDGFTSTNNLKEASDEKLVPDARPLKKLCPKDLKRWHELQRKEQKDAANLRQKGFDLEVKKEISQKEEVCVNVKTQPVVPSDETPSEDKNVKNGGKKMADKERIAGNPKQKEVNIEVEEKNDHLQKVDGNSATPYVASGSKTASEQKDVGKKKPTAKGKQKNARNPIWEDPEVEEKCQMIAQGDRTLRENTEGKAQSSKISNPQKAVTARKRNAKDKSVTECVDDNDGNDISISKNRKRRSCVIKKPKYEESSEDGESGSECIKNQSKKRSRVKMQRRPVKKSSSDEDFVITSESEPDDDSAKSGDVSSDIRNSEDPKSVEGKKVQSGARNNNGSHAKSMPKSDDDFDQAETSFRKTPSTVVKKDPRSNKRRTSKSVTLKPDSPACDWWAEVYLSKESRWICVNSVHAVVDQLEFIEGAAAQPLSYVVAYNSDETVKDVTKKYASNWLSTSWKLRDDEAWWQQVLLPFESKLPSKEEDQLMEDKLMSKPMPTTVGEFKNHPLFALQRHLLKFEAIYPPSALPLGFIRGEPIFARECVQTLHAREKWIQEGHSVKDGEEPYKIVKARPKWNKSKEYNDSLKLSLFGHWQTEPYVAPPAVDGRVPVNQYGNVDLYKPWMLPPGTVHLKDYPGLNRVARKLDIDCRQAMTGWDFHGASNHPVFEGWVVCEEHVDVLVVAWQEEQEIIKQRELEKKEQRVNDNWKRLVKGLLILRRLKAKFQLDELKTSEEKSKKVKGKNSSKSVSGAKQAKRVEEESPKKTEELESESGVVDPALNWPQNRTRSHRAKKEDRSNLFPFEKETL